MVFSDDKLLVGKHKSLYLEISKMLGMSKEVKQQLKATLKNIYKYSEFFSTVALQMPEAQKHPYSFQSLCAVIVARKVMKVEPAWNPRFSKRVPYACEDTAELVDNLYNKYMKINKKSECKTEQKENKVLTVQVDINDTLALASDSKAAADNRFSRMR